MYGDIIRELIKLGKSNIQILELSSVYHPADTDTEVFLGFTNAFDGTASAVHLHVVGADAKDTAAGVGAQLVTVIGIDENNLLTSEVFTMNGAASVNGVTLWKRVITAYISRVGSEGNAAAVIYIKNHAETETYITIYMGSNAGVTHRVYVPTGKTALMKVRAVEMGLSAGAPPVLGGFYVSPWSSVTSVRTAVNPIIPEVACEMVKQESGPVEFWPKIAPVVGDNSSFLTLYTRSINTALTTICQLQQTVFLYS